MSFSLDSRRPKVIVSLVVAIVGSLWWLADANSDLEASRSLAEEYALPPAQTDNRLQPAMSTLDQFLALHEENRRGDADAL